MDTVNGTNVYTYDANGRLLTQTTNGQTTTYTYDADGNTLSEVGPAGTTTYTWNDQGLMSGAVVTNSSGTTTRVTYQYDANGNLSSRSQDGAVVNYLTATINGVSQVVEEYQSDGTVVASYVYGNDLISQDRGGTRTYYISDAIGSTRALVNQDGNVVATYTYDAYGRELSSTGTVPNVYLYAGEAHRPRHRPV